MICRKLRAFWSDHLSASIRIL